jgi:2'-5' RNA ligase
MLAIESALVVLVPEAEDLVKPFRDRYDPSARNGCPAHVTVLYPFKPPDEIGKPDLNNLSRCFARFEPFHFALSTIRRFPGVLYLAPSPAESFRKLTLTIWHCYPETPPYGGTHRDIVPHLSIAAQLADERHLDRISAELKRASERKLPISAVASEVALLDTTSGRWQVRATFKLDGDTEAA